MVKTIKPRTTGNSVIAVLTSQLGLLALLLSGSMYLATLSVAHPATWGFKGLVMLVFGIAYLFLAIGLWANRRWSAVLSVITLVLIIIAGIVEIQADNEGGLGYVLVIFLSCSMNLAIVAWVYWSRIINKSA